MKRIISIFISLTLIISMISGISSTAVFAAVDETKLAKVLLDISGSSLSIASNKIGGVITIFGNEDMGSGKYNVRADSSILGENVIMINHRPSYSGTGINNNDTRMQISGQNLNSGTLSFSFKLYLAASSDGNLAIRIRQGSSGYAVTKSIMELGLDCYKWYTIETFVDFSKTTGNCHLAAYNSDGSLFAKTNFDCSFTSTNLGSFFLWGTPSDSVVPSVAPEALRGMDAFYAIKDFSVVHIPGLTKASILSVASDGEAAYNQKNLSFKLSNTIEGLSGEHIVVRNKSSLEEISPLEFTAQSSGEVNLVLEKDLAAWTNYELEIKGSCYSGYNEVTSDGIADVAAIKKDFHTSTAPFDMKDPSFSYRYAKLTAETTIINTSGTPRDICIVFVSYNNGGRINRIEVKNYRSFEAVYPGSDADILQNVQEGDILRLFVIDNMQDKNILFGKSWTVDYMGRSVSRSTIPGKNKLPGTMELGDFNYSKKKIEIDLNSATSAATEGVLSVCSVSGTPVYIDSITTASDGTYSKELLFPESFTYGSYTAEFRWSEGSISNSFTYYTPEEILNNKRASILDGAKSAATSGALMRIVLGLNENEEKINDNFDVFISDAGETKYPSLKNKAEVFALMKVSVASVNSYNELISLFKTSCEKRYDAENKKTQPSASNNKNYGTSSTVVTDNKGKGETENNPSTLTVFEDMKGHWAEKFASELSKRGIINGYEDGCFKGDNSLTRAELVKIICLAFECAPSGKAEFTDVDSSLWYAPYVYKAASNKIVNGFEDGSFRPNVSITREDAIVMIHRALSMKSKLPEGFSLFADDLEISSYAQAATRCMGDLGIITGDLNKKLNPKSIITRAEVAAIVCRSLDYAVSH